MSRQTINVDDVPQFSFATHQDYTSTTAAGDSMTPSPQHAAKYIADLQRKPVQIAAARHQLRRYQMLDGRKTEPNPKHLARRASSRRDGSDTRRAVVLPQA